MALSALAGNTSPLQQGADGSLACLGGFSPRKVPDRIPTEGGIDVDLKPLAHDPHLVNKIMQRRQRERERTNILLTPRLRQVGLDIAALNSQVVAKKMTADVSLGEDESFNKAMQTKAQILDAVDNVLQQEQKSKQRECVEFSLQNLRMEQRREYELSDPHMLKKDSPPGKDCGLACAQRFQGEDAQNPQKLREKRQHQASWLLAQMAEKKLRDEAEREEEQAFAAEELRNNNLRAMCERADLEELREEKRAEAAENLQLAAQHSARRQRVKERDVTQTQAHMENVCAHSLARDRHDYSLGSNSRRLDYKRCTYDQEQDVMHANARIVLEKQAKRRAEASADDGYQQIGMAYAMVSEAVEHQNAKAEIGRRQRVEQDNKVLAEERRDRDAWEKKHYRSFSQEPAR